MIVKGDLFTSPTNYALQHTIKELEDEIDELELFLTNKALLDYKIKHKKEIIESLKRGLSLWESIRVHGLEIVNMSYEEFCKQLEKKQNIIFMSDEEFKRYKKALKIIDVLND